MDERAARNIKKYLARGEARTVVRVPQRERRGVRRRRGEHPPAREVEHDEREPVRLVAERADGELQRDRARARLVVALARVSERARDARRVERRGDEDDDEFVGRENLRRVRGARRGRARGPGADVDDRTALALEDGVVRRRGRERGLDRDAGSAGEGGDGTDVRREDVETDRWTGGNV